MLIVGDRVKTLIAPGRFGNAGEIGTVLDISYSNDDELLIAFDNNIGGYGSDGLGVTGHCWWIRRPYLSLIGTKKPQNIKDKISNMCNNLY